MDRRDRCECAGLVRAGAATGLVAPPHGGRVPGRPSWDHALLPGCGSRDPGPHRSGWADAGPLGRPPGGAPPTLALGRRVCHRDRRESPLPRLAGVLRFATTPSLERAVVLRRLGRDRRSVLLGGAARGARVGLSATLGSGAHVSRHARRGHDAGAVAWARPPCGAGPAPGPGPVPRPGPHPRPRAPAPPQPRPPPKPDRAPPPPQPRRPPDTG